MSQTFTIIERQYEIYDRELLGIIWALKKWRHYIQGLGHTTKIFSDHKNLMYFHTAQKLNDQQARWLLYLSEFDIKMIHVPGTKMIQYDALSQRPDHGINESTRKEEQVYWNNYKKELTNMQDNLADWKIEEVDGWRTIFYKGKNYILKYQELWWDIVKMFHDHETVYPLSMVMRFHYFWPWKSQNCTIPVNLEAIQNTTITTKLFWPLYLGYNHVLQYIVYGLQLSNFSIFLKFTFDWHPQTYLISPQKVKLSVIAAIQCKNSLIWPQTSITAHS